MNYNQCIIVYSLRWPETCAIAGLYAHISPKTHIMTCFSPEELVELLSEYTTAPVILGIHPHESVFLISLLGPYLQHRPVLFFGQKFNYADRMIPLYFLIGNIIFYPWKDKSLIQTQMMLSDFIRVKSTNKKIQHHRTVSSEMSSADELIYHLNGYLYQMFSHHGLEEQSGIILIMLSHGLSAKRIATLLNISTRNVSVHKYKGLALLGIETGSYNIYRGILVRITLQQYSFERK
ncbi:SPI1-associated transcriptional regulator SprB [Salmonella bongori]|uniref:HTH luxR-type domain-containing protein n=3 Tax=Salmonella bongori TaxID=54736 RepID=A0A248KBX1_SALBN|nr:hypothetical protein LFZ56_16810 [Salmonella bongori serovar 66:z41:- str. SA19983605]CCC29400.1 putative AraC-family regulatory protein [Salmonella bongori NCTC 12419]VDZ80612.1 SPI1-associated transcriptional regulator SprB [Salmonella bongori]